MKRTILILCSLLLLASCNPVLMKMYGIKNPAIENEKSITEKTLKYGMDTTNIVTVDSKYFLQTLQGKRIPDAEIYDRQGNFIEYKQTDTSCNAGLFQFIPDMNLENIYFKPNSSVLNEQLEKFKNLQGNNLQAVEQADFYLLIYYAVWTGKLNKDHVKIWEDLARDNKNCKINVIKVNLDKQEYWDKNERDKISEAMSKKS